MNLYFNTLRVFFALVYNIDRVRITYAKTRLRAQLIHIEYCFKAPDTARCFDLQPIADLFFDHFDMMNGSRLAGNPFRCLFLYKRRRLPPQFCRPV